MKCHSERSEESGVVWGLHAPEIRHTPAPYSSSSFRGRTRQNDMSGGFNICDNYPSEPVRGEEGGPALRLPKGEAGSPKALEASPRCPSSRPRRATSRPTFPPM